MRIGTRSCLMVSWPNDPAFLVTPEPELSKVWVSNRWGGTSCIHRQARVSYILQFTIAVPELVIDIGQIRSRSEIEADPLGTQRFPSGVLASPQHILHEMSDLTVDHQHASSDSAIPLQGLDFRNRTPMTSRTHSPNPEAERLLPTATTSAGPTAGEELKSRTTGLDLVPTQLDKTAFASIAVSRTHDLPRVQHAPAKPRSAQRCSSP